MRKNHAAIALAVMLAGCVEEPTPETAEEAAETIEKASQEDAVKDRQRTIEEAAEEATKLIEADAKAEVDDLSHEAPAE